MKTLTATLLLVSISAFAQNLTAPEALLRTIAPGLYEGKTPEGNYCEVTVKNLYGSVIVVAADEMQGRKSEVVSSSHYRWNPGNRSFLSTAFTTTLTGSTENIFRTIAVTESTQYVVVADVVINNRERKESKVECIINL